MREQQFDQKFKQVLENLEVPYDAGTWTLLEHRLDALVSEEHPAPVEQVDKLVYHTLERLEVPYQPAHWDLLAQRMLQQTAHIRRIRLVKMAEAAILLLLLANLNLFPGNETAPGRGKPKASPRPDVPVAAANPGPAPRISKTAGTANDERPGYFTGDHLPVSPFESAYSAPSPVDLLAPDYRSAQNVGSLMNGLRQLTEIAQHPVAADMPAGGFLPFPGIAALDVPDRTAALPAAPTRRFRNKRPVYVATFASADQHFVLINGERRPVSGYGAGMTVGVRQGKWGAETGLFYGHNGYEPQKKVEIYKGNLPAGYYGSTLTRAETDLLSVPLKVSRQVAKTGATTIRAVAGATAHFAVQKTYDYGTIFYNDPNPPSNQPAGNPKLRKSGRGVLEENGRLGGNVYATLDAGIRIEHPLGRGRYAAFIEPGFRQALGRKGVGPDREPVNTLTLQAGVMAFL